MKTKEINEAINIELGKMLEGGFIDEEQFDVISDVVSNVLENSEEDFPTIKQVDDNHIIFDNIKYYKNRKGYFVATLYLHVAQWIHHNGAVPEGYEIHHIDENPSNNDISNLQLLTHSEHQQLHLKTKKENLERVCIQCGKTFVTTKYGARKYCSDKCRAKHNRKKEIRKCAICGKELLVSKYKNTKYCRSCSCRLNAQKKRGAKCE